MNTDTAMDALSSWHRLNEKLRDATEHDAHALLSLEMNGAARLSVMNRIHGRFSKMRHVRERMELKRRAKAP